MRVLVALAVVWLPACGYKGPLYLPKAKPDSAKSAPPVLPEPAPDRPVPAEAVPAPK